MSLFGKNNNHSTFELPDRVIIYKSELEYISRCILDYPNIETGGNLFGFYTPFHIPIIQYVLGPGRNADHNPTHFKQDEVFFDTNADMLIKEHALHHIGTWHSHHKLSIDYPSGGDEHSILHGMINDGIDSFLLIIGNIHKNATSAKAYSFSLNTQHYRHIPWVVLDEESPIRLQFDKKHNDIIYIPCNETAVIYKTETIPLFGKETKRIVYPKGYWLNDEENKIELKKILSYLTMNSYEYSLFCREEDHTLKILIKNNINLEIIFPLQFPKKAPEIQYNNNKLKVLEWKKSGSISQMFIDYFEMFVKHYEMEKNT